MMRRSLRSRPPWLPEALWVLATALLATIVAIVDLKLWRMDPDVPIFDITGDGMYYLATVKGIVENGWFWTNPDLGAPFGQSNYDFAAPFGDVTHSLIVKALGVVLGDPVRTFNAFFLLTFALVAAIAYAVLRDLGSNRIAALVAALLFTLLPYHLERNETHLFLTAYYAIALAVWLVVRLAEGDLLLRRDRAARRRTLLVVAVCLVVGAASNYYAVFALLIVLTVVPVAAIARRSRTIALQGAAVAALVGASFTLCHAPALIHPLLNGANESVAKRQASDSELFGLKLTHMVIPRPDHRVGFLAQRGERYRSQSTPAGEDFQAALGTVATVGLPLSLLVLLTTGLAAGGSPRRSRVATAGAVALASFLTGTVGGASALIAYELSPQVRAWNRLSLVIAFAALLAIALALTALGDRLRARGRPAWVVGVLAAAVGVVGVLDQTSPSDAPDHAAVQASWKIDDDFVAQIEARLPADATVVQLPYMRYPEAGRRNAIADYDMFTGYVHSDDLRWTYGAVQGRASDWLGHHPALTPEQLASAAAAAGFGGVYLDLYGYDGATAGATSTALAGLTGPAGTLTSADGRLQFFDLRAPAARLSARTSAPRRRQIADALVRPTVLRYGSGFSYQEIGELPFRWTGPDARLELDNTLARAREVRLTAQLFGGTAAPSTVTLTLPGGATKTLQVSAAGLPLSVALRLPPGRSSVRLQTAGAPATPPPGVVRDLRLRVVDPQVEDVILQHPRYVAAATP